MKALVVHGGSCENELKQLRRWLEAEGCEVGIFDLKTSSKRTRQESLASTIADFDTLICLVDSETPLEEIQLGVMAANAKGKEVVCVQLGGPVSIEALEKYGSASIPFKQNLIVSAVCHEAFAWTDEEGDPREDQDMEHHKCKKKKPKDKNAAA